MIVCPNVKINLGLSVLRRREDGYHDIRTLFVPYFGLKDRLEVIPGDAFSETSAALFAKYGPVPEEVPEGYVPNLAQAISPDGKVMITIARAEGVQWQPLSDLTVKAYRALEADFDLPPVKIFLEKGAPVGAGLGGGSADAAFALRAMSELFGLGLSDDALASYAASLGSDCAFFVYNRPMLGEGRGEVLTPFELPQIDWDGLHPEAPYEIQVVVPEGISVSTAEAYRGIVPREAEPLAGVLSRPVAQWKGLLVNDFETTVFAAHPELAAIKESLLESGAEYAAMSGSGSALFAIYRRR